MNRETCKKHLRGNISAALFSLLLVWPTLFMAFDRQLPLILTYREIVPNIVSIGDLVEVHFHAQKVRHFGDGMFDCQGTFVRRIIDSTGVVIETKPMVLESPSKLVENGEGDFTKVFTVPVLIPGPATYQIITKYACNPLQRMSPIVHEEHTVHFRVKETVIPAQLSAQPPIKAK